MDLSEFDIDFLSQRLSDNPQSPLFARLADLYLSKNQSSEALKLCEVGVQAYSSYATGYVVLGKCYLALNQNSKAKLAFAQALHFSPFNQVARKLLSEVLHTVDESPESSASEVAPPLAGKVEPAAEPHSAAVVGEETAPPIQEPSLAVEDAAAGPAIEETTSEMSQPEEVQIVESPAVVEPTQEPAQPDEVQIVEAPDVVETAQEPAQPDAVQIMESPAEDTVRSPIVEESIPETIQSTESPATEPAEFPGMEEYVQTHSARLAEDKTISLDEYLGLTPATPTPPPVTELDTLTSQLENAGRIIPQEPEPEASPKESVPSDSLVITPTLAEIYASQGEYGAAIQAYEILILSKPDERDRFEKRIKELQAKLYDGG